MKGTATLLLLGLLSGLPAGAVGRYGLPSEAKILEVQDVGSKAHPNRALVLWMLNPERYPFWGEREEPYTCPDETAGSHYRGPTRVSLLDTSRKRILNTIQILNPVITGEDELPIPYEIRGGYYYRVKGGRGGRPGRPTLLWLKDYNGDGKAQEVALFLKLNCTLVWTTLIGYSERQDRVINYPVTFGFEGCAERRAPETSTWAPLLFATDPVRPGKWSYDVHYQVGGSVRFEVGYDPEKEAFEGLQVSSDCE